MELQREGVGLHDVRKEGSKIDIVSGFGRGPIAEHYQEDFKARVTALGADQLQGDYL